MPAIKSIKRLGVIVFLLKRNHYPSLEVLLNALETRDLGSSERSIRRLFQELRDEFGIFVRYDAAHKGYFIDWQESSDIFSLEDLLELGQINQLIIEYLRNTAVHDDYIYLESRTDLEGIDYLVPLMKAIKDRKVVEFTHHKYKTEQRSQQLVQPYFLKEFERRWYLVGIRMRDGKRRVYGLDRIHDLRVSSESFRKQPHFHIEDYSKMVGVHVTDTTIHRVQLRFSRLLGHYIRSLPIHASQTLLQEDDIHMTFELECALSYELFNLIMKYGAEVQVLSPQSLVDWVREEHEKSVRLYDND